MRAATARMLPASCLLARHQSFLLIGGNQTFPFVKGLLADLPHLLMLLLGRERRVGADALDLRTGVAGDGMDLLHHRLFNAGLLQARSLASPARRLRLRGWSRSCRRSALSQQRPCAKKKNDQAEKFPRDH